MNGLKKIIEYSQMENINPYSLAEFSSKKIPGFIENVFTSSGDLNPFDQIVIEQLNIIHWEDLAFAVYQLQPEVLLLATNIKITLLITYIFVHKFSTSVYTIIIFFNKAMN